MGKSIMQAQKWLIKSYPDSAQCKTTICQWYADFKRDRRDIYDASPFSRSNETVTPEIVPQVLKIVNNDRKGKNPAIVEW